MRYKEIIDYASETRAQRLERLRLMYADDDADDRAQEAETDLMSAKAMKLRADALAALAKVEAEYDELVFESQKAVLTALMPTKPLRRPD